MKMLWTHKTICCVFTRRFWLMGLAVVLMAVQFAAVAGADAGADDVKSETVYAVLGNDGTYSGATVVNCFHKTGEILDYGHYTSVENLMGPQLPDVSGDMITWPASATGGSDAFYYQGETDKPLPVDIDISYRLDGKETDDIAGKTGTLDITFDIKNMTGTEEMSQYADREIYTPFAVSVSMTFDNSMFDIVDMPENATAVLSGGSYTLSYSSFPLPEDTFSYTLFGNDISLEPISIIVLPKAPPGLDAFGDFMDVDGISDGTDEMIDGISDMQQGTDELLGALHEMRTAAKDMQAGLADMDSGAVSLSKGADALRANAYALVQSAQEFYAGMSVYSASFASYDAGMEQLYTNVTDMTAALSDINDAVALVDAGVSGIGDGLDGAAASNINMTALAGLVAAAYPSDTNAAELLAGLSLQQAVIDGLVTSSGQLETLSGQTSAGMQGFYTAFSTTFSDSVLALRTSSAALYATCIELVDGAGAINDGCRGISGAAASLSSGTDDLCGGTRAAVDTIPEMINGIDSMIDGVESLESGLAALNDDGLKEMKSELDGLDGYLNTLSDEADAYGSFMDKRNNDISSVQFILKTEGIN